MSERTVDKKEKTGLYFSIFAVLLLVLFLILGIYISRQRTNITPQAKGPITGNIISFENSYIFTSPTRATAGGDLIRVTVFILDSQGRGVIDKKVAIGNNEKELVIKDLQNLTDDTGKAVFDISSKKPGVYYLDSLVEGQVLPQRVKVTFD